MTAVHLLRHAHAGDASTWAGPDATRPLTDKGRSQAERLGRFLENLGFVPDLVLSSPKTRAMETAQIVADILGVGVRSEERLGDVVEVDALDAILADHGDPAAPVLVGHDPDLSDLVASLCGADGVPMRKGAFARIEIQRPLRPGGGTLRWLVPPDLLKPER